jgi:DNA-binding Lrp family transcriptional regulator
MSRFLKTPEKREMPIPPALDSFDRKILQQLTANGRTTWSDLAEIVGLSLTPTIRRVRQLEKAGYITGYFARLDEKMLAGAMSVFVTVTLERQVRDALDTFESQVMSFPEVMSGFLCRADRTICCVAWSVTWSIIARCSTNSLKSQGWHIFKAALP